MGPGDQNKVFGLQVEVGVGDSEDIVSAYALEMAVLDSDKSRQ
jgi:hypothetical protein